MEELMLAECLAQNAVPDLGHLLIVSAFLAVTPDYQAEDVAVYSSTDRKTFIIYIIPSLSGSQSVLSGPASPRNLLDKQILRPHPDLLSLKLWGCSPPSWCQQALQVIPMPKQAENQFWSQSP